MPSRVLPDLRSFHYLGVACLLLHILAPVVRAASTVSPVDRHAYAANVGWIDARADGDNGARVGEFICSGFLYAANVGWINLGSGAPVDGVYYRNDSGADFGINRDPIGHLNGRAWGANIGWLVFTNRTVTGASYDPPKVDLLTGRFSGFAYAPNIGWITLSNLFAHVKTDSILPGADSDGDGIADAWELVYSGSLTPMTATSNADGDRATDLEEYLADTDPLTPGDELRIIGIDPSTDGTRSTITWTTRPTRVYRVQQRPELAPSSAWIDSDVFSPDPGATTTRTLIGTPVAGRYFRVQAGRPLNGSAPAGRGRWVPGADGGLSRR
jgi:hypothetical protein